MKFEDANQTLPPMKSDINNNRSPIRFDPRRLNLLRHRVDPRHSPLNKTSTVQNAPEPNAFPDWWIHLWSGLVRDPTSKHYRLIRRAIWLYLYLLIVANRRNGTLFRRVGTIEAETGFNIRSIHRWLRELRSNGYITSSSSGRSLTITITKWRPLSRSRDKPGP